MHCLAGMVVHLLHSRQILFSLEKAIWSGLIRAVAEIVLQITFIYVLITVFTSSVEEKLKIFISFRQYLQP